MGRDKAFLDCDGRPLAAIAGAALSDAGAMELLSVGGDRRRLAELGFVAIADETADGGPLGGLLSALDAARGDWVVVLACDLPRAGADTIAELLAHADDRSDVVVPLLAGRPQLVHAVWRRDCREHLRAVFDAGERRLGAALEGLRVRRVTVSNPDSLADADTPADLPPVAAAGVSSAAVDPAAAGTVGELSGVAAAGETVGRSS